MREGEGERKREMRLRREQDTINIYSLCRELKTILHLGRTTAALTKIPRTFTNFAAREKAPNPSKIANGVCEIQTRCIIMHLSLFFRLNFRDTVRANFRRVWSLLARGKVRESSWDFRESSWSCTQVNNRSGFPTERGSPYIRSL